MSGCSHKHNFELKSVEYPYYCERCGQLGFKMGYTCDESGCNLIYHKQCGNPETVVKHPFSTKCVFYFNNKRPAKCCLCDVCGKDISGFHYQCSCSFIIRHVHPHCLGCEPTFAPYKGITMHLHKVATEDCMICGDKYLCRKVYGWAYISSNGDLCYHVSCVMKIIHEKWKSAFMKGTCDPFQVISERFPKDMNRKNQMVKKRNQTIKKMAIMALEIIVKFFTGHLHGRASLYSY
ncbi:hypothetical protein E3N88_12541 [Mikania micrantha]|uniref:DC1 domain-containing protein n=1 Tax=Mikania micrantha TaxID=192012 RepID=A0A5N6P7M4_9ASTR|nr:hypothetical protein E3N88_12539 [Mikania micrantha]KAD5961068.1 hypothetical protein E3N88_12541 [Mikania micrantha]